MSFTDVFKKIFGTKADRDMKAIRPMLDKVLVAYEAVDKLSDDELREKCQTLKDLIQARIADDEARIAAIKEELEKDIPLSQKEALATESDKLVKKVDEKIEEALDQILPDAFAIMKSTARRFKENEVIRVKATEFDRNLSATKEFVTIEGDYAVWLVETRLHGIWSIMMSSLSVVSFCIRVRSPRWQQERVRLSWLRSRYSLMHWQARACMW